MIEGESRSTALGKIISRWETSCKKGFLDKREIKEIKEIKELNYIVTNRDCS